MIGNRFKGTARQKALAVIRHLSYVQIDTLSVAERAHHHVIHTRLSTYRKNMLWDLLAKDRSIFEYWSHAAAYLPIEDFRYSYPLKDRQARRNSMQLSSSDKKAMQYVFDAIKHEGPKQSRDFGHDGHSSGPWFDYKPAKMALERLFNEGKIMVSNRVNFQKVYDLPERLLPNEIDTTRPTEAEMNRYLINRCIHAQGLVTLEQITYLRKGIKPAVKKTILEMLEENELVVVKVANDPNTYYSTIDQLEAIPKSIGKKRVHILSPFDNLIIQRKRTSQIFGFDYNLECYVPAPRRIYGYYVLPVLYGDRFVARFDPKADRASGVFHVKNLVFEPHFKPDERFELLFHEKLREFAAFCGCAGINFHR